LLLILTLSTKSRKIKINQKEMERKWEEN